MGKINVLSFAVANLIAAGEVVDRPASAVKELLENAIDAGATRITVEIQNGGVAFLRVSDNGCGMDADDLPVAVRRHATSKIKTAEDLEGIETLGFRGEALAAIASVSDMRIISKTADAEYGAELSVKAGNIISLTERACATGTTIIVENLFANVPARRKFLKRDVTEASAVSAWVEKIALSEPSIAFRMIVDGAVKFETEGNGDLKSAIYSIFGREFAGKLISVCSEIEGVEVKGFIGRSDNFKSNRNFQNFFINGRYIKSKTASAALEQAYSSYIPSEKFPCCVINIKINPRAVDVNVHPAKLEVKFSNEKPVFDAVYYTVRSALEQDVTRPALEFTKPRTASSKATNAFIPVEDQRKTYQNLQFSFASPDSSKGEVLQRPTSDLSQNASPNIRQGLDSPKASLVNGFSETATPSVKDTEEPKLDFPKPLEVEHIQITKELEERIDRLCREEIERGEREREERLRQRGIQTEMNLFADSEQPIPEEEVPEAVRMSSEEPSSHAEATIPTEREMPVDSSVSPELCEIVDHVTVPEYRILGEAFNSYVFVESEDRVLVIDKHAAHERVLFEDLRARMKEVESASQLLMLPIEVMLTTDELQAIENYREEIEKIGFRFSTKRHSADIDAIPCGISTDAVCDMFIVIADHILNETGTVKVSRDLIFEKALYQASCKAAIKAGREYPADHVKWLVDKLMRLPDITFCPHGRPIAVEMTKNSLDHQFERK